MPRSYEEVRQLAYELPGDQRIQLAESLWESVDIRDNDASETELDAAWDSEIKSRLDEIDSGVVELVPGEQVRDEMIASLSPQARARLHD